MSRKLRSYLPGMVFHVTSRTNGKEHWFDEALRSEIVSIFATSLRHSDAQLLAYVVMTNHFHLIIRQGVTPLGRTLQSINGRIALKVQRRLGRTGHIFERPYGDRPCADPDYLRNAIVYTHLNPVRAGICSDPLEYEWSSHRTYAALPSAPRNAHAVEPHITPAMQLFAHRNHRAISRGQSCYDRFVIWRRQCDMATEELGDGPVCIEGDEYWALHFGIGRCRTGEAGEKQRPDLRDLVRQSLREMAPPITLEHLRLRSCTDTIVSTRRAIIKRAVLAGFPGADIARYLNVSKTTVSRIATSLIPRAGRTTIQDRSPFVEQPRRNDETLVRH